MFNSLFKKESQISILNFNLKFQSQVLIWNFNLKFRSQISISNFDLKFQSQISISNFNLKFQSQIWISDPYISEDLVKAEGDEGQVHGTMCRTLLRCQPKDIALAGGCLSGFAIHAGDLKFNSIRYVEKFFFLSPNISMRQ